MGLGSHRGKPLCTSKATHILKVAHIYRIVDLHSHLGVDSSPELSGADDTNSLKGITQPWLRSVDGINTHDAAYQLSISGGVTTSVILPGMPITHSVYILK